MRRNGGFTNTIKELQQARNIPLKWLPHKKTHGPRTAIVKLLDITTNTSIIKTRHSNTECLSPPTCMHGQRGPRRTRATRATGAHGMRSLLPISMGNAYAPSRKRNKRRMHLSLMGN